VGGTGCGTPDHAQIFHNNRLINLHCTEAARRNRVTRYLYASSTCVYPKLCENLTNNVPQDDEDAYQGTPQDAYGWANLISQVSIPSHTSFPPPVNASVIKRLVLAAYKQIQSSATVSIVSPIRYGFAENGISGITKASHQHLA